MEKKYYMKKNNNNNELLKKENIIMENEEKIFIKKNDRDFNKKIPFINFISNKEIKILFENNIFYDKG